MRILTSALVLGCAVVLAGCAALAPVEQLDTEPALLESTVPRDSTPGFLAEPQDDDDQVQNDFIDSVGIDPASIRLQGEVEGERIYLAVKEGGNSVQIIHGTPGTDAWGVGGSIGNVVLGSSLTLMGEGHLQYLPQGTSDIPEGWTAFSDWIAVPD